MPCPGSFKKPVGEYGLRLGVRGKWYPTTGPTQLRSCSPLLTCTPTRFLQKMLLCCHRSLCLFNAEKLRGSSASTELRVVKMTLHSQSCTGFCKDKRGESYTVSNSTGLVWFGFFLTGATIQTAVHSVLQCPLVAHLQTSYRFLFPEMVIRNIHYWKSA